MRIGATSALSGALVVLAAIWPSSSRTQAPATEPPALESFDGTFVLAGDRSEMRGMSQAIDRVVDQLNLFIREIARGEIHRRITAERRIELDVIDERTMTLAMDEWGPVRVTLGAGGRRVRGSTGEDVTLTMRWNAGRLVQHAATPGGARTNVFALSADEQRLHMHVRITSSQLPADIRYVLTYRRAS